MASKIISRRKIAQAIPGSGGIIKYIAQKAGYASRMRVKAAIDNDPELLALFSDERDTVTDMAEAQIVKRIRDGDIDIIKWYLARTSPRYKDKQDVTSGGEKLQITVRYADDNPDTTPTA